MGFSLSGLIPRGGTIIPRRCILAFQGVMCDMYKNDRGGGNGNRRTSGWESREGVFVSCGRVETFLDHAPKQPLPITISNPFPQKPEIFRCRGAGALDTNQGKLPGG